MAAMRAMLQFGEQQEQEGAGVGPVLPDWEAVAAADLEAAEIGSSRRGETAGEGRRDAQL